MAPPRNQSRLYLGARRALSTSNSQERWFVNDNVNSKAQQWCLYYFNMPGSDTTWEFLEKYSLWTTASQMRAEKSKLMTMPFPAPSPPQDALSVTYTKVESAVSPRFVRKEEGSKTGKGFKLSIKRASWLWGRGQLIWSEDYPGLYTVLPFFVNPFG